jgi:putative membrane protein
MLALAVFSLTSLLAQLALPIQPEFSGWDGFLGTRASFMLDVVVLAMFAVVPLLMWSIYLVAYRHNYALHKRVQLALAGLLLVAVALFEIDMRFFTDWEERAAPSPFYTAGQWDAVWGSLVMHLLFAIPTLFLWIYVVVAALRKFPNPPMPNEHSRQHRLVATLGAVGMFMTAVTGWIFYWLAFTA